MEIKFSSRFIKIIFGNDEEFPNRSLLMAGEPLDNGFEADANSMKWVAPFDIEEIDENIKKRIKELINSRNDTHGFKILFTDEVI